MLVRAHISSYSVFLVRDISGCTEGAHLSFRGLFGGTERA